MGKIVNNYELLEQLGQGGMGVVYKARHIHFDEIYALKRLWEQFGANEMVLNLFLNEAKILRKLNHKNIVQVTDVFSLENQNYIVMEYIKGRSLDEIIKKEVGPIRRERAINLFKQMLEGIAYIHDQPTPIIHRDIKPLNLLVTEDDIVKITDFGIAKVLDAGQNASTVVKGTPIYMSPEQIMNPKSVDIRTDVYSLGMTFYEMLCAKTPFSGDTTTTPTAVYAAIMNDEVPSPTHFYPGISDELSAFVMKAIHKDRSQRFASANEMLDELERLQRSGATTIQESSFQKVVPTQATKSLESIDESAPTTVIDNSIKKSNILWLWGIGFGIIVGLVLLIIISGGTKASSPTTDTVKVDAPVVEAASSLTMDQQQEMVLVEGGTFTMGCTSEQTNCYSDEKPTHQVTVDGFLMGKYEVTQELWQSVMGNNPSKFKGSKRPVEQVYWYAAVEFCNKLSEKEGLQKAYSGSGDNITCDFTSNGYRLPTEAEWEYAARGGASSTNTQYSGSNTIGDVAWYDNNYGKKGKSLEEKLKWYNSRGKTNAVGTKSPNQLGIYDMSGNVWEWCWDWYEDYSSSTQTNPTGPNSGSNRVLRGGSWSDDAKACRVAVRLSFLPGLMDNDFGFRLVRTKI